MPTLATRFERLLASPDEPEPSAAIPEAAPKRPPSQPPKPAKSTRSDALVLLETLQREARFVDLIKESLENYGDAEVGAAARDVLRQSGEVVERFFGLEPIETEPEGTATRSRRDSIRGGSDSRATSPATLPTAA